MALTKYPNGISSMGMPVIGGAYTTTGSVWFVDSNTGSNGNSGQDKDHPFADIDYAIGRCTASKGDIIFVMPGHSETAATQITCDVAGVSIIGLGRGQNRPTVTAHASAVDVVNVTADDVYIENIRFYYAASCTAFINVGAADFCARNCWFDGAATPEDHVTVTTGGTRFHFDGCRFESQTDGPDTGILIEVADLDGWIVENCIFNFHGTGLDEGGVMCSKQSPGGLVKNCVFIGMDATAVDLNSSSQANTEGIICDCRVGAGAAAANIDTLIDAGGYALLQNYGTDIPSEGGGLIPVTTPA